MLNDLLLRLTVVPEEPDDELPSMWISEDEEETLSD